MAPALTVENLGKDYLAETLRYRTLRDGVAGILDRLASPLSGARPTQRVITVLDKVSFEIQPGETVGLIGKNGSGKSTLLKILSRITPPSRGRVGLHGRTGSLLEVGTGFHPELTGRENIFFNGAILGMSRGEILRAFDSIVSFAEVEDHLDKPVKRYSSGMFTRLAFSVAAHLETEILLLDEVLAVGDMAFQQRCFAKVGELTRCGRTVLLVSHNMHAVRDACRRCLLLDGGRLVGDGATDAVTGQYEFSCAPGGQRPGVFFDDLHSEGDVVIRKVELLGKAGEPLDSVATWAYVRVRIHVESRIAVDRAAVSIHLNTESGAPVMQLSTMPGSNVPVRLRQGTNCVDCEIPALYLAAGQFMLRAGVALQQADWLVEMRDIARLEVQPANVFDSAFHPPAMPANLIAIPHRWSISQ